MSKKIRYGYTDGKNWIFQTFTIEIKDGDKSPSRRKLTPDEEELPF